MVTDRLPLLGQHYGASIPSPVYEHAPTAEVSPRTAWSAPILCDAGGVASASGVASSGPAFSVLGEAYSVQCVLPQSCVRSGGSWFGVWWRWSRTASPSWGSTTAPPSRALSTSTRLLPRFPLTPLGLQPRVKSLRSSYTGLPRTPALASFSREQSQDLQPCLRADAYRRGPLPPSRLPMDERAGSILQRRTVQPLSLVQVLDSSRRRRSTTVAASRALPSKPLLPPSPPSHTPALASWLRFNLTESVYKVVMQTSTPAQIRQLVHHVSQKRTS